MKIDYLTILRNHGIEPWTDGKNVAPGWVNVQCCWCDDHSNHLGFNPDSGAVSCWRCGRHGRKETLARLLSISEERADELLKKHKRRTTAEPGKATQSPQKPQKAETLTYPANTGVLGPQHTQWLKKRHFDPFTLQADWGVKGTGPVGFLDHITLKNRILAPVYWGGEPVSWQTRVVNEKTNKLKYITCPSRYEVKDHKAVLYGKPEAVWEGKKTGIIVEGITDAWRLDYDGVAATFGIEFTTAQVVAMADAFKDVVILYDNEPVAIQQARELQFKLKALGKEAWVMNEALPEGKDPADLKQKHADKIVEEVAG